MTIDRKALASRIRELHDLSADEKSALLELLNTRKKYGLVWEDKPEKVEDELREKLPVLKEVTKRRILSKESDAPNHILIEGDNLYALTALQYTHAGKIDVIYIDPPYNTGNKDFIYNDSFVDKEDAWRHSKWLSFMSKRLRLAKHLLKETGIIFISIDDNEQAQLKLLSDEIFGDSNFITQITWQRAYSPKNQSKKISKDTEFIISYAKNTELTDYSLLPRTEDMNKRYKNIDNDPRGNWKPGDLVANEERKNGHYIITGPFGDQFDAPAGKHWSYSQEKMMNLLKDNRLYFGKNGKSIPSIKQFLTEVQQGKKASTLFLHNEFGHNDEAKKEILDFFPQSEDLFSTPKPTRLIKQLIRLSIERNPCILDFFAGSGTTLHATMDLNAEDAGSRQCILVTNNENDICEKVTYERNKRVIQGYTNPNGEMLPGLTQNNLRYYQVGFVERAPSIKSRKELAHCAADLLCIRENCYEAIKVTTKEILVFGKKRFNHETHEKEYEKVLVVILEPRKIELAISMIKRLPGHCKVYVFSPGHYAFDDEFEEVAEKIDLCALPEAILQAYNKVLPKAKRKLIMELEKGALEE
ncbi:MAG: site-specific DNA-methyltransferase [Victivallales bacterium]|jgi:adenine-specific DNA-methyltransferase